MKVKKGKLLQKKERKREKQRKQKKRKSQSKKRFFQPQRPSFPFNIKQRFPYCQSFSKTRTNTRTHTRGHIQQKTACIQTEKCPTFQAWHGSGFMSIRDSWRCQSHTRERAHIQICTQACSLGTYANSLTLPLCHSLSPARSFSHHKHSPFPVISSLFISLPCLVLALSFSFSTFKDMYGHTWPFMRTLLIKKLAVSVAPHLNVCPVDSLRKAVCQMSTMSANAIFRVRYCTQKLTNQFTS